ncbi:hypothetical protein BaRGS_00032515, partial [Batillaria attramentaria]
YIATPGWEALEGGTNLLMDCWVSVVTPSNHVTMVSFVRRQTLPEVFERCLGEVEIYSNGTTTSHLVWSGCYTVNNTGLPDLFDADTLHVHYVAQQPISRYRYSLGFRLLYSFHTKTTTLPERAEDGTWNCSVPSWTDFEAHFACSQGTRCSEGNVRVTCPYSGCEPGETGIAGRCYVIGFAPRMTWMEALEQCAVRGMRLAVLNSRDQQDRFTEMYNRWTTPHSHVIVGLRTTSKVYQDTVQWEDGTVGYDTSHSAAVGRESNQVCAALYFAGFTAILDFMECYTTAIHNFYICEKHHPAQDPLSTSGSPANITLSVPTRRTLPFPVVHCPRGHVTHTFLACDVWSDCFTEDSDIVSDMWGVPSSASCPAPLTSLPPFMSCDMGSQYVPYSLVCDFRKDCADGSDEEFCVFESCGKDSS